MGSVDLSAAAVAHRCTHTSSGCSASTQPEERSRRHASGRDLAADAGTAGGGRLTSSHPARRSLGRQKLVDRAKLVLSSDVGRRWTLADVAAEVRVSPVYLTQVFQQVEGMPLYRYQLRLRLSRALHLLERCNDLGALSLELGFSSHSHFTSAFRQVYERTPLDFQRSLSLR